MNNVIMTTYNEKYLPAFVELNREWIETYFALEPMDLYQLQNPQESILDKGGEIFFLLENDQVLGTCALVPHGVNSYELAKMAVSPKARGKGYGDILMKFAISWAQEKGIAELTLLSNTILEPAISLYKKHGFQTHHLGQHPDYKRCNIEMNLPLLDKT